MDFGALKSLKSEGAKKRPDALEEAARQFETLFLQSMLKSMRQAGLGEGLAESKQSNLYRDLYDKQLALSLGQSGSLGIADLVVRQLRGDAPSTPGDLYALPSPVRGRAEASAPARSTLEATLERARGLGDSRSQVAAAASTGTSPHQSTKFDEPIDFVRSLWRHARQAGDALGVRPEVVLAQAALETGWGRHMPVDRSGRHSHNLFGIKAGRTWDGARAIVRTLEFEDGTPRPVNAAFRAYPSFRESFDDYVHLLRSNPRYAGALESASEPSRFLQSLQQAGYATDPSYARKIERILDGDTMRDALLALKYSAG